jgi:hypothetical protein
VEVRRRQIAPRSKIRVLEVLSRRIDMIGGEGAAVADVVSPEMQRIDFSSPLMLAGLHDVSNDGFLAKLLARLQPMQPFH